MRGNIKRRTLESPIDTPHAGFSEKSTDGGGGEKVEHTNEKN
jgi:hypothetical protein